MTNEILRINGIFGLVTVEDSDGLITYKVNGEKCAEEESKTAAINYEEIETKARFILAGVGHGFAAGRLSK